MSLRLTEAELQQLLAKRAGKPARKRPNGSRWETEFASQLDLAGLGGYRTQHRFLTDRRFRFDFAFVPERIAVEIDGQVHSIRARREGDVKRGQLALMAGWTVLHVLPSQVRSGEALSLVKQALKLAAASQTA